jgi:hypothetical protein
MFGWKVASIGSDHSVAERNAYIDQFNDPDTDIQILLTSMDLSAYGLNLHKACCKGIIVQWPWNANHLLQILGRLPRIGQKRVVEWVIFHMSGTIYDKMQTIIWSKYIKQLAVESKIPKDVHGVWANIAAHGVIHRLFNLPFNRWLWDKTAFQLDVVGYDGKLRRNENLAVFFERVAALLNDNTRTPPIDQPGEMLAWKELQSAGRNDLIAGAYAWMDRRENDGEEPTVTFAWLRDYCVYDNLAKLSNATKAVYLSDEVADQLERDPQFPLMPMESEVPAYLAYMTERAKQDLLVAERAALKRGAPEHDAMGSNTDNDVDSPSQSPSRRALRHKAKRARLAREQALDDEE